MLPHLLASFKIQKYYQNEPRFNGFILEIIYLIKDGECVITLDEYSDI